MSIASQRSEVVLQMVKLGCYSSSTRTRAREEPRACRFPDEIRFNEDSGLPFALDLLRDWVSFNHCLSFENPAKEWKQQFFTYHNPNNDLAVIFHSDGGHASLSKDLEQHRTCSVFCGSLRMSLNSHPSSKYFRCHKGITKKLHAFHFIAMKTSFSHIQGY